VNESLQITTDGINQGQFIIRFEGQEQAKHVIPMLINVLLIGMAARSLVRRKV
jgi:hypothetical protein